MMRWFYLTILILVISAVVYADTPLISGQVVIEGEVTRYIYTVTNILQTDPICGIYDLQFPREFDLSHSEPAGWSYYKEPEGHGGRFHWIADTQSMLQPGQSAVFEVYTSQPVATLWTGSWQVGALDAGVREYFFNDGTTYLPIPVPIPEPSSILALAGGLAGIGGVALRRRK